MENKKAFLVHRSRGEQHTRQKLRAVSNNTLLRSLVELNQDAMFCIAHSQPKSPTGIKSVPEDVAPLTVMRMMLVATHRTPWSNANDWHIYLEIPKKTTEELISWLAPGDKRKFLARYLKIQCHPVIQRQNGGPPFSHKLNIFGEVKPHPKKNEAEYITELDVTPQRSVKDFISSIQDGLERWKATHDETYDLDTREWVIAQLDTFAEKGYIRAEGAVIAAKADILVHWMERRAINKILLGKNVLGPLTQRPPRRHGEPPANASLINTAESESKSETSNLRTANNETDSTVTANRDQ